mmetsp:Transcript_1489/g.2277  ORF Transcript_1489/g.2277 Transcript_1489/m.2277 type:complete len:173 (+) Transcript_1489:507-1025(+)
MQKEFFKLAEQSSESEFTINRSQFAEALKIVAIKAADQEILDKLFTLFDKTGDGQVNFRQFVIGASVLVKGTTEEKLQLAFELYDTHQTGKVSKVEMLELLTWLSQTPEYCGDMFPTPESLDTLVNDIFAEFDSGNSQDLDFKQFYHAVSKHPLLIEFLDQNPNSKFLTKIE